MPALAIVAMPCLFSIAVRRCRHRAIRDWCRWSSGNRRRRACRRTFEGRASHTRRRRARSHSGRHLERVAGVVLGDHGLVQLLAGPDADDPVRQVRRHRAGEIDDVHARDLRHEDLAAVHHRAGRRARSRRPARSVIQNRVMRASVIGRLSAPCRDQLAEERNHAAARADDVAVAHHGEARVGRAATDGWRRRRSCRTQACVAP